MDQASRDEAPNTIEEQVRATLVNRPRHGAPGPLPARVLRTAPLSASMIRVTLGGDGLRPFVASPHADSYIKLVFRPGGLPTPLPLGADGRVDLAALTAGLPAAQPLSRRSYTVRAFDPAPELTLDVLVHGPRGVAGPWAQRAAPGDTVLVAGPGGTWSPDPTADHHLLLGDLSAVPAIAVALARLPRGAAATAVIEVPGPEHELAIDVPPGVQLTWVHADGRPAGTALVAAVRSLPWPAGRVEVFLHGEAGAVKDLRHYVRLDRGVRREQLSVSGYWRLGFDDEGWRAGKAAWRRAVEESEQGID